MAQAMAPDYAIESINNFLEYLENAMTVLQVSTRSLNVARDLPKLYESLSHVKSAPEQQELFNKGYEAARKDAEVASKEGESGFPFLHQFTLVGMWGAIEASIEDLMVALLSNEPELLRADVFSKIRIPLADFEMLDKDERMRLLVSELQRTLRSDQRQGVTGFESVLASVELSGEVTSDTLESLWEMNHIRNVIVHRRSCADRNFVLACPKLRFAIGDRVVVTADALARYSGSLRAYAGEIVRRINSRYSASRQLSSRAVKVESGAVVPRS